MEDCIVVHTSGSALLADPLTNQGTAVYARAVDEVATYACRDRSQITLDHRHDVP